MCGIAGILYRNNQSIPAPAGRDLLSMSACLQHRGRDSAGIAVFDGKPFGVRLQVILPPGKPTLPEPNAILALGAGRLSDLRPTRDGFSVQVRAETDSQLAADQALVAAIEQLLPGATVSAMGSAMTMEKAVGSATELTAAVGALTGTHGIAHLRLATESKIDPAHAQPFWGRPYPDIAVTHNGHITNYLKMRQKFEAQGFTFASRNDSEIIGIYLGRKMADGLTLQEALVEAAGDLDGSYSFIVATRDGLGVARDPFATKPLLFVEDDERVALASEPQALYHLMGEGASIREIRPREVRTWMRNQ